MSIQFQQMADLSDMDFDEQLQLEDDHVDFLEEPPCEPSPEDTEPVAETVLLPVASVDDQEPAAPTQMGVSLESPSLP